jgi:hypothetical protein
VVFIFIAYAYSPQVLTGKIVNQNDISSWQGMANEIVTYNSNNPGERALWTNSMFGGMPATSISVVYKGDFTQYIYNLLFTGARPASYLLLSLIGGFLLFLAFGTNIYLAILGAIAITFCSYNMQIIQVGHNSKMVAIAFMPWVLASIVYSYRKCAWLGAILFAFALSFQIKANHPQITYYLAIIIIGYAIWQLCSAIKDKLIPKFIKTSIMLLIAGLLGIATNTNHLWPTYEYAEHTMRGGTELTQNKTQSGNQVKQDIGKKTRSGLDLQYATSWSYGINETPNLLIPNFNGGSSSGSLTSSSKTYSILNQNGYAADQLIKQMPLYWGPQPFTAGPMYMGAISIFLFILGFFVLKGGLKWWIGGVSLLSLMLAWGYHLMPVSEFFFNWAPLYNKFRTVSMILVILQILIPIMAVLTLNEILFNNQDADIKLKKRYKKGLYSALGITGGFCLIFILIPSLAGDFVATSDSQMPQLLTSALQADRVSLLRADAFRSLIFIVLTGIVLMLYFAKKITAIQTTLITIILLITDLWAIDKRYLNDSHFVTKKEFNNIFNQRPVDKYILEDKDLDYRVLDLSVNTFNDAYVSYHHKTIGGYSPAKLQRYQDIIDNNLIGEISEISNEIKGAQTLEEAQNKLSYHPVLSMLNTKYIVLNGDMPAIKNQYSLGNAWFVSKILTAKNADEEISILKQINPANEAVMTTDFYSEITNYSNKGIDSTASISLKSYSPNKLVYEYNSTIPQIAVFSEIYYSPGWSAKIIPINSSNNTSEIKEIPILRANYILRAASLPAGNYNIEFNYAPESFSKGELISKITSGILLILLLGSLIVIIIKQRNVLRK